MKEQVVVDSDFDPCRFPDLRDDEVSRSLDEFITEVRRRNNQMGHLSVADLMSREGLTEVEARQRIERNRDAMAATAERMREMVQRSNRRRAERDGNGG